MRPHSTWHHSEDIEGQIVLELDYKVQTVGFINSGLSTPL